MKLMPDKNEKYATRIISYLERGDWKRLFKGRNLDDFYSFLREQGIPARGFLLTFPLEGGSLAWFRYSIESVDQGKSATRVTHHLIDAYIPEDETELAREPPEEWKVYPVWRIK